MKRVSVSMGAINLCTGICIGCVSHKLRLSAEEELTLAFKRARSVKILSYSDRMFAPPLAEGEENKNRVEHSTVARVVGDLRIPIGTIKEEIILGSIQRDSLLRLLQSDMCEVDSVAICYNPRYAILFCDSKNQPFSYVEICFECTNYRTHGNFIIDFCYEKSQALKGLFQSIGIEYFELGER